MTTTSLHPLAADYLDRLERAARRLPRSERRDLLQEIGAHLAEAIEPGMTDAEALTVLDRLGEPEDIVAAERADDTPASDRRGLHEWSAIFLLLFGGFLFGFGWIVGLILLWSSRAWNTRDKLIGTLIVPGGLATVPVVLVVTASTEACSGGPALPTHCTGGPSTLHQILGIALFAFFAIGPIVSAMYLARRAR